MRFSVLDRAARATGEGFPDVVGHARHVERLGFERFLVAEHHGVPGIPAGQPALLAAHVAAHTQRIRVGTGGIMVLNHAPFIVAEQIRLLETLYPGRIDIGLGSSVGFTAPIREALGSRPKERFEAHLGELLALLDGTPPTPQPADAPTPSLFLLAGFRSALTAARFGLGVILGGPVHTQEAAAKAYRENFAPGVLDAPHVISSLNIAVADTEDDARALLLPEAVAKSLSLSTGEFPPLDPRPDLNALTAQQRRRVTEAQAHDVFGTPRVVRDRLHAIAQTLGVDEFLVTGDMPDRPGRARSEELLAQL
ncbi:MsnO8 family LLM class oxidoreductase [Corynebacterium phoceense]|uniref:MsnO8 family LLM class oxidoreductase n=1 Tax=Corynebacterium phoceense TaxID=1686286 RepID=UPI00211C9033|nr:MsnO8 family LLM class oxidoreductase [Corynebacterium phoceense]MCQ9331743.1 MsnO8 family LLM class oxidoreductase [Corynebacterium phoceense]MCQ9347725.1 MsnO8 family LLM class oxidoreductase [Corynebacterium phoceense]